MQYQNLPQVIIYTDGACSGNPGPGGWGCVLIHGQRMKELSGGEPDTTNQRMEMQAALSALSALKQPCRVQLYSDSAYLINGFRQHWLDKWQSSGWLNAKKQPVENQDLWRPLLELSQIHQVEWIKVKGHSGDHYNEICDQLARNELKAQ